MSDTPIFDSSDAMARRAAAIDKLSTATDNVHASVEDRAVGGQRPQVVVTPGDVDEVSRVLQVCAAEDLAVVPRGAGTRINWGMPPTRLDVVLDVSRLDSIVEHSVGEFVVVAQGGTRLDALQDAVGAEGQYLAIDPFRRGTVGGLVATGHSGPLRLGHGPVRDLVIGAQLVRSDGVVAKAGGKVVKNVAGYDLGKLLTGSFGTLAVLTQAAFRLHPIPQASAHVTAPLPGSVGLGAAVQRLIHSQTMPVAIEIDRAADGSGELSVRLHGVPDGVAGCAELVRGLLGDGATIHEDSPGWWGQEVTSPGETLVRLTYEVASAPRVMETIDAAANSGVTWRCRGSVAVGVLWAAVGGDDLAAVAASIRAVREAAKEFGGSVVVMEGPAGIHTAIEAWGPVSGLELMRDVKGRLDPQGILAPGRFVGGI